MILIKQVTKSVNPSIDFCLKTCYSYISLDYYVRVIIIQVSMHCTNPDFLNGCLYHVTLGCYGKTSLTLLSWFNSLGVNSMNHRHYTMASAN